MHERRPIPDLERLLQRVEREALSSSRNRRDLPPPVRFGTLLEVGATVLKAHLPWACQGELCQILPSGLQAEVVSVQGHMVYLSAFSETTGLKRGLAVTSTGGVHKVALGEFLRGKIVDGLGRLLYAENHPIDSDQIEAWRPLESYAPDPMSRSLITDPLPLGIRALDGPLTFGQGQRMGIFAAAGGGKSTLLSMICEGSSADLIVLALVGERGREVREFMELTLSAQARQKSVVVVSTSDRSALERMKATFTATTIAEFFRDKGMHVLLMVDSITRYARAAREIGLASGEPPVAAGFPPSVFATLPRLLERAGPAAIGSITGIYTVLVEADNMNEPVADEVRSILDGHVILSRKLSEANHYPAIDVLASVSRVMSRVTDADHRKNAGKLRRMWSLYKEVELLVRVGEYQQGQDAEADEAVKRWPLIQRYLQQSTDQLYSYEEILQTLDQTVNGPYG